MARLLKTLLQKNPATLPTTLFFVLISIFSVLSFVIFLCVSHFKPRKSEKQRENSSVDLSGKKLLCKINSNINGRVHSMKKIISWKKVGAEDEEGKEMEGGDFDCDEAVWRKKIMMGERCRPLDFSGKICYDSEGNLLPVAARNSNR